MLKKYEIKLECHIWFPDDFKHFEGDFFKGLLEKIIDRELAGTKYLKNWTRLEVSQILEDENSVEDESRHEDE